MPKTSPALESFFRTYAQQTTDANFEALGASFAETFLAAGPDGSQPVRAADFARAMPRRREIFDRLGRSTTTLESVEEIPLDTRYSLARTRWRLTFHREGEPALDIPADSTFLVDIAANPPRILVYLAHQDLLSQLRELGISPS